MTSQIPTDQSARDQAVFELSNNVVVMAGAGTGKTTLLIHRLATLITEKKIPVERIVALTYTKKAAEELRERLELKLRESLQTEAHDLCRQAIDNIPKAQIGTIHSFAGHLLRLYPIEAQVDPHFQEDDGTELKLLFDRGWAQWCAQELGDSAIRAGLWKSLLEVLPLSSLEELAWALVQAPIEIESLKKKADLSSLVGAWCQEVDQKISERGLPARASSFSPGLSALRALLGHFLSGRVFPQELVSLVKKIPSSMPKGWEDEAEWVAKMKSRAVGLSRIDDQFIERVLEVVLPFMTLMSAEIRRKGLLSFDALLLQARNLLRDHLAVREALKRQYSIFLIDEFQDTDPLQGEILFFLCEKLGKHANTWREVELEPGRLFIVGDPKQSIYRFRGADMAAYDEFKSAMLKQGALELHLTNNFRSHGSILGFVNQVFSTSMIEELSVQPRYIALETARQMNSPSTVLGCEVLNVISTNRQFAPLTEQLQEFEATLICSWIKAHVGKGLRYGEVAILMRSTSSFPIYINALRQNQIPFMAEGERSFYERPEIVEFINLLEAIDQPNNEVALAGVLRSALGSLTDTELLQLKKMGPLDFRKPPHLFSEKLSTFFNLLNFLHEQSRQRPVSEFLDLMFSQLWVLELFSAMRHGEQAAANILKVRRLAVNWAQMAPLSLTEFVRRLKTYKKEKFEEGENPLADSKFDAVKMMTIHKAKGLEFPVVFLPNLGSKTMGGNLNRPKILRDWGRGLCGLRVPKIDKSNSAYFKLIEEASRHERAEEVRVFYVASTRAKNCLILLTREKVDASAPMQHYMREARVMDPGSGWAKLEQVQWDLPNVANEHPAKATSFAIDEATVWLNQTALREADISSLCGRPLFLSPSKLMKNEPEKIVMHDDEVEISTRRDYAVQLGLVCHKILEMWDFSIPAQKKSSVLKKRLAWAANHFELSGDDELIAEASQILGAFFNSPAYVELTSAKIIAREIPFFYPFHDDHATVMRGVIDVIYEIGGRLIVGDYKTNRVQEPMLESVSESYKKQKEIYLRVVSSALGRTATFSLIFLRLGKIVPLSDQ